MTEEEFLVRIKAAIGAIAAEFKPLLEPSHARGDIADKAALVVRLDILVDYSPEAQQELPFEKQSP